MQNMIRAAFAAALMIFGATAAQGQDAIFDCVASVQNLTAPERVGDYIWEGDELLINGTSIIANNGDSIWGLCREHSASAEITSQERRALLEEIAVLEENLETANRQLDAAASLAEERGARLEVESRENDGLAGRVADLERQLSEQPASTPAVTYQPQPAIQPVEQTEPMPWYITVITILGITIGLLFIAVIFLIKKEGDAAEKNKRLNEKLKTSEIREGDLGSRLRDLTQTLIGEPYQIRINPAAVEGNGGKPHSLSVPFTVTKLEVRKGKLPEVYGTLPWDARERKWNSKSIALSFRKDTAAQYLRSRDTVLDQDHFEDLFFRPLPESPLEEMLNVAIELCAQGNGLRDMSAATALQPSDSPLH